MAEGVQNWTCNSDRILDLQRSKKPAYMLVNWDGEDGHSIVEGKVVDVANVEQGYTSGVKVQCTLREGVFPATIIATGSRGDCYRAQIEFEKQMEVEHEEPQKIGNQVTSKEGDDPAPGTQCDEVKVARTQNSTKEKSAEGVKAAGTQCEDSVKVARTQDSAKKKSAEGVKAAGTQCEDSVNVAKQARTQDSAKKKSGEGVKGGPRTSSRPTEKPQGKGKTTKNAARKAKAKAQAAAEQSLMEDIKESQRVEDVRASIPQDDDYDQLMDSEEVSPPSKRSCQDDRARTPAGSCENNPTPPLQPQGTPLTTGNHDKSSSLSPSGPMMFLPTPQFYSPWASTPSWSYERDHAEDDSSSNFSRTEFGLMGLRDLVLSMNSQTQAMLNSMNVSLQNIKSEVTLLKEQMRRPVLKKRKSEEKDKGAEAMETNRGYGVLGDPNGLERNRVQLHCVTQAQVLDAERKSDSPEKLARALLQLLFTSQELAKGNCTRPMRSDIEELDSERIWAIKCHVDFVYPFSNLSEDENLKQKKKRWTYILQKVLNPICRHLRTKAE